jgi:hypothetical protein
MGRLWMVWVSLALQPLEAVTVTIIVSPACIGKVELVAPVPQA